MASALQPEIWRLNMPGVQELITYSIFVFATSFSHTI